MKIRAARITGIVSAATLVFGVALILGVAILGLAISGCNLAPTYDPPHYELPSSYRGSGPFVVGHPDDPVSNGHWWEVFGDAELNQLEEQLERKNPSLQAAAEAYAQARDLAAQAQGGLYPQVTAQALTSENRESAHHLFGTNGAKQEASNQIAAAATWEPDFWHAIRNSAHAQKRLAQASAADLAAARLSLQAELASDFVALRGLDVELEMLHRSIVAYKEATEVARLRAEGSIASGLDLARARSELESAKAQETETELQRDLMQHAIALLVGSMASNFSILPAHEFTLKAPEVPTGVPSALLQRRPDIASAERRMAAANASIGVARAAFFPNVTLGGTAGFEDNALRLADLPNSLWSIGAGAILPLFQGGIRRAALQRSWSLYEQTRDDYRATVLAAFREVEDGLSETERLAVELAQQREASQEALRALSISTMLYQDGLDNYLSVAVAQVQALATQTAEVQLLARHMRGVVSLIRALGGGWSSQELPSEQQTLPFDPLAIPRTGPAAAINGGSNRP